MSAQRTEAANGTCLQMAAGGIITIALRFA